MTNDIFSFNILASLSPTRACSPETAGDFYYILRGNKAYLPFNFSTKFYSHSAYACSQITIRLKQQETIFEFTADILRGKLLNLTPQDPDVPFFEYTGSLHEDTLAPDVNLLTLVLPEVFVLNHLQDSRQSGPLYFEVTVVVKDPVSGAEIGQTIEPQFPIVVKDTLLAEVKGWANV